MSDYQLNVLSLQQADSIYATNLGMFSRFDHDELANMCSRSNILTGKVFFDDVIKDDSSNFLTQEEQDALLVAKNNLCRVTHDADSIVDSYLKAGSITTPLVFPIPTFIQNIACDIARYYLVDTGDLKEDDIIRMRYKEALAMLKSIAKGEIKLEEDLNISENIPIFLSTPPVFGRNAL